MKPRIIFIDLHTTNFLCRTMNAFQTKNKVKTYKHQFLVRYLQKNGYEIRNLVTSSTSIGLFGHLSKRFQYFKEMESKIVVAKNGLNNIKAIKPSEIKKDDIVVGYMVYEYQLDILKNLRCYKIVFGNHFISINNPIDLNDIGVNAFINEIDLSQNEFVNKYINIEGIDSITVPYIYADRFVNVIPFNERCRKAMAVGTSSTVSIAPQQYKLYRSYFKTELVQPMREEIYDRQNEITSIIDCYISKITEKKVNPHEINNKFLNRLKNLFVYTGSIHQGNYTSFDMVETFNKYKIAICPEELVGMPGIGFVEAMACGCVYIGLDHSMYRNLGLIPNVHYITYDGTFKGLVNCVENALKDDNLLKSVSDNGTTYIRNNFNELTVASKFEKQLIISYNKYLENYG